jgi:hypothetical protein
MLKPENRVCICIRKKWRVSVLVGNLCLKTSPRTFKRRDNDIPNIKRKKKAHNRAKTPTRQRCNARSCVVPQGTALLFLLLGDHFLPIDQVATEMVHHLCRAELLKV